MVGRGGDWKGELFLIVTRRTVGFRAEGPQVRGPFYSFFPSRNNNVTLSLTDCGISSLCLNCLLFTNAHVCFVVILPTTEINKRWYDTV